MKLLLPLLLSGLAACASLGPSHEADALLAADREFARDTQVRRLAAWLAAFDEQGSQFDEEVGLVSGAAAIRAQMQDFFADPLNELWWQPDEARVSEGGKLGSTSGRYRFTHRRSDGSAELEVVGRYFDIWRRKADGTWKLLFDVGDPDG